ncbi:hypothetical protein [Streptomyces sp. RTGN2]|uniref:hypothetical protein n=1 Tax=Streptomyces sp. RTGN2 TaxID=3016525 RepID=UPI0025574E1F|nr:hypothetical protein [Streptomyces sp. RTGN2]
MRLSSYIRKAAMGTAVISLLAGCAGGQGTGGVAERAVERPAYWTDLPVLTGTQDVIHTDTQDRSYEVRITVKSLIRGSEGDMRGARVDKELKGTVPHYLTFEVTNLSRKTIPSAYMVSSKFTLNGTDWTRGEQVWISGGKPDGSDRPCEDTAPKTLAPGDSYTTCLTYALPEGIGVLSLTHNADGYLDEGGAMAAWPVEGGLEAANSGLAKPGDVIPVQWNDVEDGTLDLPAALVSVRRGKAADLARLDLDLNENERRGVPYYVLVTYTNPGPNDLYPGQADDVRLLTEGGRRIPGKAPFGLHTKIPDCPSDWLTQLVAPGDSVTECSVHLVTDDGDKPFAVGFAEADRPGLVAWRAHLR